MVFKDSCTIKNSSLGDTSSITLDVATGDADYVYVTVDNGTTGSATASYDIGIQKQAHGSQLSSSPRNQTIFTKSGRTDLSWRFEAAGRRMSFPITNTSGSGSQYEAEAEARSWGEGE